MRVLVSGDEYCFCKNGTYYLSDHGLDLITRYLMVFDEVVFAVRTKYLSDKDALGKYRNAVKDSRITIACLPFFQGPKQLVKVIVKLYHGAKNALKGCDLAILRLPSASAFVVWRAVKKARIPYATEIVFDCQDGYETSESGVNKVVWKIMHLMQVRACNHAIGVSCVTARYLQRHYFPLSEDAILSHYSSINLTPDFYYDTREFQTKDCYTIVHVANQVQYCSRKGHNEIIEVVSLINKQGFNVKVIFIGEDYDNGFAKLRALAERLGCADKVQFAGFLSVKEMRETMTGADIALLPTRAEGLPRVVIEAMAMGLPCISSPVSGNPELIDNDLLIDYNDVEGMSRKIIELISTPYYYESVSRTNFLRSKDYSSEVLMPRRKAFYSALRAKIEK